MKGVPDGLKPTYFEQDSFGGYTTVWEAKGFFLRGWEAGGGTGLLEEMGNRGGIIVTAGERLPFTRGRVGEMEGKAEAEVWEKSGGATEMAVDRTGDEELETWLMRPRAWSLFQSDGVLLLICIFLDKVIQ